MISTAIVFDHRGRVGKNQEGPLEVRVTVNRKPYYINAGVRVLRAEFKYGVIVDRPDSDELNERLNIVVKKVEREINACIDSGNPIDVAEIRRKVYMVSVDDRRNNEFLDWVDERIELLTHAKGTIEHYKTLRKRLGEYNEMRAWSDVTVDGIMRWNAWLHSLTKPLSENQRLEGLEPEHLSDDTILNYHKNLKKLLYIAEKTEAIKKNPYSNLKGEFKRSKHDMVEYLSEKEMQAVMNAPVQRGSQIDVAKDMFIMQMFTGMAYADLMKFDISEYKEVDGKWIKNSDRVKSGVAFVGHLLPPVVEVLKKYGWKVPRMCNQDYNRALKKVQEKAGINTNLHSHLARHTFGTFMLRNKVDIVNLQKMMGHKKIEQTLKYANTIAQSIHEEFDMIEEKIRRASQQDGNEIYS